MEKEVLQDISYGMYIVTTEQNHQKIGCIINTVCQITSKSKIISISLNKDNYTNKILKQTKKCAISILSQEAKKELITKFGYFSSKDIDKFQNYYQEQIENIPVILEGVCSYLIGEVINIIDSDTHDIFLIKITHCKKIEEKEPMTYQYYREKLKGASPKNAPTYTEEKITSTKSNQYRCMICGYIYDDAKEKIKFEDLPSDWKCPRCGVGKEMFEKI